ncbi:glycosyl transferase [Dyadobacter psychrotolerans]|uniref:Glycosyl transferase n=1 Tax=Dyadobacter psychrotolerans TaxID=2541721 RepID=A0A4R5DS02_9BACT|nr:glycosyl transferase [Dyadobacter psychrotolerans]TDE14841.1 glycosyl transferase [Dyadobacter psychrotolerans]
MINFCTLFNSTYLTRGLAMYDSLEKKCADFHLYIIAFDQCCYDTLSDLQLKRATVISLDAFEDKELLAVKPTRTPTEYCWTCTPASLDYCIKRFDLESCTYIDADLLFFSDPEVLIEEMADSSVLITEHRYTPQYDQTELSGKYCVQFVCIKNDSRGQKVLQWWKQACLDWCYNRAEDNKFGDQKYLDDWCTRFEGVHELQHLGGGVAPWNMQQYRFEKHSGHLIGTQISTGINFDVVFFHFHNFRCFKTNVFIPAGPYQLNENLLTLIYGSYINSLQKINSLLRQKSPIQIGVYQEALTVKKVFYSPKRVFLLYMKGSFRNYYHQSYFAKRQYGLSNQS